MKRSFLTVLAALVVTCSCKQIGIPGRETPAEEIRTLDRMPREQLRLFLKGYAGDWRKDTDRGQGADAPPMLKPVPEGAKLVDLVKPEDLKIGAMPLAEAIGRRRSRREYSEDALSNEELSFLLWCTQGISHVAKDDRGKIVYHLRTVPSAGARHPFETYLTINKVDGVKPGLYRFLPLEHKLLPLREDGGLPQALTDACYGQDFPGKAAVIFIWAAVPARTEWAYGCIAHKMIAVEAGHVCENLYLAAEAIGAGACAVLGYDQEKLDRLIGVDGREEFAVYLAPVGKTR